MVLEVWNNLLSVTQFYERHRSSGTFCL